MSVWAAYQSRLSKLHIGDRHFVSSAFFPPPWVYSRAELLHVSRVGGGCAMQSLSTVVTQKKGHAVTEPREEPAGSVQSLLRICQFRSEPVKTWLS